MDPAVFIRRNTTIAAPPLVPEIRLHLATEITPIWQATEESLARCAVPPPFWAFAWAGGQALARYLLDHSDEVAGRFVLDFLGKLWKVRWLGLGASYFWGHEFSGWSAGVDVRLQF